MTDLDKLCIVLCLHDNYGFYGKSMVFGLQRSLTACLRRKYFNQTPKICGIYWIFLSKSTFIRLIFFNYSLIVLIFLKNNTKILPMFNLYQKFWRYYHTCKLKDGKIFHITHIFHYIEIVALIIQENAHINFFRNKIQ